MIKLMNITKEYKRPLRKPGFTGVFNDLFNRKYEVIKAVDDITFEIRQGEIVGYIGPNGAGKSTTIKMMTGILVPTRGFIEVNGKIPYKNRREYSKKIGVVFGQRTQLWWDIPVLESFKLIKDMYSIPEETYSRNIQLFSDVLDIHEFEKVAVRQLSLGQRMRADICAALLHDPDILFLDEPTIGLDVVVKEKIRKFIKEINASRNTTVILTTHDMDDIESLCSRVIVIDQGKKMYDGEIEKMKKMFATRDIISIEIDTGARIPKLDDLNLIDFTYNQGKISISYNKNEITSSQILSRIMAQSQVIDFEVHSSPIDEVVRQMYLHHRKHVENQRNEEVG